MHALHGFWTPKRDNSHIREMQEYAERRYGDALNMQWHVCILKPVEELS